MKKAHVMKTKVLSSLIDKSGKTGSDISKKLGVSNSSFRSWVSRNRVPAGKLEPLASELGTTSKELERLGVNITRSRDTRRSHFREVFPLIRAIVDSGVESVTYDQFLSLLEFCDKTGKDMSPALVREYLNHIS